MDASRDPKANWAGRVFKNTYTRGGRRIEIRGWSVKIQHQGTRRTFSLAAKTRAAAQVEAQAVYQTIVTQGWEAATSVRHLVRASSRPGGTGEKSWSRTDARHWRQRLLRRRHALPTSSAAATELSVRIDHAGRGQYFPLGTSHEDDAADRAREVYVAIVREGWEKARQSHPCELTVALHWTDNPLAWTYATLHTVISEEGRSVGPRRHHARLRSTVVVIEPEATIRRALSACVGRQDGFVCVGAYETATAALSAIVRRTPRLVLTNHLLPHHAADGLVDSLRRIGAASFVLFYSTHEDSDQLFKATPGGAAGYLLKRTAPDRLFEPIMDTAPATALTADTVAAQVRRYFQKILLGLPAADSGREMAKLTHREHEILNLLSRGCVDKEIADTLRISIWTVHGHLKRIYEKLGVHTRTEAAIKYLQK